MELRRTADIHILDGSKSLAQLRIKNGTSLDLCTLNAEGRLIGPDDEGSMAVAAALPSATAAGKESVVIVEEEGEEEEDDDDDDAPPPEYSMIDRVRLARGERRTTMSRSEYVIRAILTSIAILVVLGLFIALPVALIAVGFNNMSRCPERPSIPVWMIVSATSSSGLRFGGGSISLPGSVTKVAYLPALPARTFDRCSGRCTSSKPSSNASRRACD